MPNEPFALFETLKTVDRHTAEEFLDAIAPSSEEFLTPYYEGQRQTQEYIFRGHKNDDFKLIPTALRLNDAITLNYRSSWGSVGSAPSGDVEEFRRIKDGMSACGKWTNKTADRFRTHNVMELFPARRPEWSSVT